jgi:hypothetical protein
MSFQQERMFFFEKKEPKNFSRVLRTKLDPRAEYSAPQALERWDACGAGVGAPAGVRAPTDKSFLLLFFKKEALCLFFSKTAPQPNFGLSGLFAASVLG